MLSRQAKKAPMIANAVASGLSRSDAKVLREMRNCWKRKAIRARICDHSIVVKVRAHRRILPLGASSCQWFSGAPIHVLKRADAGTPQASMAAMASRSSVERREGTRLSQTRTFFHSQRQGSVQSAFKLLEKVILEGVSHLTKTA